MAGASIYPASQRPSTAVAGLGDQHEDNIYSAVTAAHGGIGTVKAFVSGQGSPIPALTGTAYAAGTLPAHYLTYTPTTTVIEQSGQLGNSIGDFECRAIGVSFDLTAYAFATGAARAFGATPFEVADLLSKTRMEIKVSNKRRIQGPTITYPNLGGMAGTMATTVNAATLGAINNGPFPTGRRLRAAPILVARNDVLVAEFSADAALAFSQTSFVAPNAGQATLVWIVMVGSVRGDVR